MEEDRLKKAMLTFLKVAVFFIGWAVAAGLGEVPSKDPAVWRFFAELIPFAVMLIFTVVFLLIEKKEVRIPVTDNFAKGTAVGTLAGLFWIGAAAIIPIMTGALTIGGRESVPKLWLWIISAFINVIMQELLVRGYIYRLLKKRYNLPLAVVVTTALFTLMHGGAFEAGVLPVINVVTMCLFTTALYESEKTIAAPIMAHAVWNIIGALVLGGVSLADDYPNIFTMTPSGSKLLSGGEYKIEASIIVLILNTALMCLFTVLALRKKSPEEKRGE